MGVGVHVGALNADVHMGVGVHMGVYNMQLFVMQVFMWVWVFIWCSPHSSDSTVVVTSVPCV